MAINETCYICVCERDGIGECRLGFDSKCNCACTAAKYTPHLPIPFSTKEDAFAAISKYTDGKGWRVEEVRITNSI